MRTQFTEVGPREATRKENSIRKAVVCPKQSSMVQSNAVTLSRDDLEMILYRLADLEYQVRGLKRRVTALEEARA